MGSPEVKDLFYKTRFVGGWHLLGVMIYTPVGLALALLRVFISLQAYLLALLLLIPELSFIRKFVLRAIALVLGVLVIEENAVQRDKKERVLVANNISILDHLPIHLLTFCFSVSDWEVWPLNMKVFTGTTDKQAFAAALRSQLSKSSSPLLIQPEDTTTNGQVGLLRFSSWCGNISPSIQPVVLRIWRPLKIAPSTLGASFSTDLFWFLFSPITVFRVRYLPVITRLENETEEEMSDRIAQNIASDLGIAYTKFTSKDKREYEKRVTAERLRAAHARSARSHSEFRAPVSYEIQRMAQQVSEVLPYVPQEAIIRDLSRTRSVDLTISNILEGTVRFTPLPPEPRPPPSSSSYPSSSSSLADGMPRSAQDRMMSFVERKARLIEDARRRYMEKHGLIDQQ